MRLILGERDYERSASGKIFCGGDHCSGLWNLPCDDPNHPGGSSPARPDYVWEGELDWKGRMEQKGVIGKFCDKRVKIEITEIKDEKEEDN